MSYLEHHHHQSHRYQYGAGTLVKLSMSPVCMNVFTCDNGLKRGAIHKNKFQCQFNMKIMRLYSIWYRHLINIRTYIHMCSYLRALIDSIKQTKVLVYETIYSIYSSRCHIRSVILKWAPRQNEEQQYIISVLRYFLLKSYTTSSRPFHVAKNLKDPHSYSRWWIQVEQQAEKGLQFYFVSRPALFHSYIF